MDVLDRTVTEKKPKSAQHMQSRNKGVYFKQQKREYPDMQPKQRVATYNIPKMLLHCYTM